MFSFKIVLPKLWIIVRRDYILMSHYRFKVILQSPEMKWGDKKIIDWYL